MPKRRIRKVNSGHYSPAPTAAVTSTAISVTPPRVSPWRVDLALLLLTVGGFAAIGADSWMSWEGFSTMPIDWWIAAILTAIVAVSQIGSGIIQALGGDPFKGIGGSTSADDWWGITLKGLYVLDIFSNFAGFGGTQYLSINALWADPLGTIGLLLWNATLAVLLAFGDEILFRLRDRIAIGAQKNQQLAKIRAIQVEAHNKVLDHYRKLAVEQAEAAGQNLSVAFDWLDGGDNV
ncbi:hypothetical protein [Nodosilinea sp. E11]|uniref:hypothetical protein n=1 Tax=Nodosilinea sp. E11 TaxID=3037479 RepID=UPI00293425E7|nr:hypothetical protein [Nodosilinea sp. E11]WOD37381.1 hypothetical protein RRF56_02565 [Nodosilinea sp. E11]WOD37943.1 hypothetical protein RRF56_17155 [Nodosilinea sp. E11]